ncbi:MAG: photosynthetic reaction center cytochrome c subunit [Acidobacteria bacterium]|nr:photosynthetic reaction center cytochrome c subunit [Acidobacteriota bacterium]
MNVGSRRALFGAAVIGAVCLWGAALGASQAAPAAPAQTAGVPMSEQVFKNIQMLRGIPVDTFFDAMGMFANAMGNDCTFCHVSKAYFDKAMFAEQTPRMQRARGMIAMMNTINKQYFAGQPRVTCYTCHAGSQSPRSDPDFMTQYGTPIEDPNIRDFPTDRRIVADQVFDKYFQALGGVDRLAKFTSFTGKGTYAGFDTSFDKVPVEVYGQAPGKTSMVVHLEIGASTKTYDGTNAWLAGPDTPMPLMTLTEGNLDRFRLEGMVAFPSAALKQAFAQWRGGRTAIDDKEVIVLQGSADGQPVANLYFDESGLLVRLIRWTRTPVGFVPTEIDYSNFRDVSGVKVPFNRRVRQTYMEMTLELSDVQANTRIDASRFAKPAPVQGPGSAAVAK